jgi:putative transport protein
MNVPQPVKLGLAGGPLIIAILLGKYGPHFGLVTYTTMSANLMLREIGLALFLAAVGIGAGDGFIDAIAGGGYKWVGYGVLITVIPLAIVALIARLKFKINYYTMMGMMSGAMTDPPALGFSSTSAGNDMPAMGYATVYPVVMFLRVLTAQLLMLMAIPALVSAAPIDEIPVQVEESVEAVDANATVVADGVVEENTADEEELNYEDFQ